MLHTNLKQQTKLYCNNTATIKTMMSLSSNCTVSFISITAQTIQKEFHTKDTNSVSKRLLLTLKAFLNAVLGRMFAINITRSMFSFQHIAKLG